MWEGGRGIEKMAQGHNAPSLHPRMRCPRHHQVTTEEERAKFTEQLTAMEDWLYMDGEAEGAKEFRAKLKELKDVGGPMKTRAQVR